MTRGLWVRIVYTLNKDFDGLGSDQDTFTLDVCLGVQATFPSHGFEVRFEVCCRGCRRTSASALRGVGTLCGYHSGYRTVCNRSKPEPVSQLLDTSVMEQPVSAVGREGRH